MKTQMGREKKIGEVITSETPVLGIFDLKFWLCGE